MKMRFAMNRVAPAVAGVAMFFALWEVVGAYRLAGLTWPRLTTVLAYIADTSHHALLGRAAASSFASVAWGYGLGTMIGLSFALVVRVFAPSRAGVDRFVALVHATPPIALAPVFMILLSPDAVPVAIAALAVGYLSYVAATSGLESTSRAHHDLFSVLGSRSVTRFARLELPSALPAIVSGQKLAVPVAFMGAIVGEWFGASRGLGLLMISAMQNFQIPLLWAAVLITTVTSLVLYGLLGLIETYVLRRFS
ncbi:ABC transporter permease [Celeribacter sp.]|uniref:ABC transporter permease n=1 Tax=Celeribacter sp. TaxID=1890673 RepID=UPI003A8CB328